MKKLKLLAVVVGVCVLLSGCAGQTGDFDQRAEIGVTSRESGSGTRGAFVELFGVEECRDNGEKWDRTTATAVICKSTGVMMTTVADDRYAVGYTSLGTVNGTVKALKIDGVRPTVETVLSGEYPITRSFYVVTKGEPAAPARDFLNYVMSTEGQAVVQREGYVPITTTEHYVSSASSGKLVVSGSSSVAPVMEKLKEEYQAINRQVMVEIQQSDSSTGVTDALDGTCDIAMVSRELKTSEIQKGLTGTVMARDGIVVIVHPDNPLETLTKEQVRDIFIGTINRWDEVLTTAQDA